MTQAKSCLIVCLLFSVPFYSYAGTLSDKGYLIILNNPKQEYRPGNRVLLFEDKSGELNFHQIQALKTSFKPNNTNAINPGTTSSAIWCMLKLRNQTNEKWYIEIGESYVDLIDLYSVDQEGNTKVIRTGLLRSFKQRSIKVNHYIIPMDLDPNEEKTYYIRAKSSTILKLPLVINSI